MTALRFFAGSLGFAWFMASIYGANLFAQIMMGVR